MTTKSIAWLICICTTTSFILLWFCVVKRELCIKQSLLGSAKTQLTTIRKQYVVQRDNPDVEGVFHRSLDIYHQSVLLYNQTLHKPWIFIPGVLMGFRTAIDDC